MTPTEFFRAFNVPFIESGHHHCRPGWIQIDCPYCSPNWKHWRLGFNCAGRYFSCWACGKLHFTQVLELLCARPWRDLVKQLDKGISLQPLNTHHTQKYTPLKRLQDLSPAHVKYLKLRGFDAAEVVATWSLRATHQTTRLPWRLFIPITRDGEAVSWTTRSLQDEGLRYVRALPEEEAVSANSILYGADLARHAITIHEGPLDAWAVGIGGTATMGLGYSRAQVLAISKFPVRVVCFDAEPAAQSRARKLCRELEAFPGTTTNVELACKDAAEALRTGSREIRELRRMIV